MSGSDISIHTWVGYEEDGEDKEEEEKEEEEEEGIWVLACSCGYIHCRVAIPAKTGVGPFGVFTVIT